MTEQTFIKINAVVGRADDGIITIKELGEFEASFVEWLERCGYDTCTIWELITEHPDTDITKFVKVGDIDGEHMPLRECACGQQFDYWDFILSIYPDMPTECPSCGRKMYFSYSVRVYEVAND